MQMLDFLSKPPEIMDLAAAQQTIVDVAGKLPTAVGFYRSGSGWSGQMPIKDTYDDGSRETYSPNTSGGNFGHFEMYSSRYELYLAALLPQTDTIGSAYDLAEITCGRIGRLKRVNPLELYWAPPEDKLWALGCVQEIARSVLEWYGVELFYPSHEPRHTSQLRIFEPRVEVEPQTTKDLQAGPL